MTKILLRALLGIVSMVALLAACVGWGFLGFMLPQPFASVLTFLGWVALAVGWQEGVRWANSRISLLL